MVNPLFTPKVLIFELFPPFRKDIAPNQLFDGLKKPISQAIKTVV
ncbi:hypothetical protein QWZ13_17390 [Reinekea marina]|nr:hypothetical protein [Reinekea marina]MDN3650683.1 hypothetical protein [Reinekea marina]